MIITKKEMIQRVKDCGQEIVENAANIVNDYKFGTDLTITCYLSWDEDGNTPRISIDTEFIPERFIKRLQAMGT